MGRRFAGNSCRLISMIGLSGLYFFVELIVGQIVGSVALTADAFHMLSDVMALFVGLAAVRISRWPRSSKNTYGWQRAEVLGTLVNTVMLVTLCFTILVNAIHRFFKPEKIENPRLMIYVGSGGLLINIVGLLMFCGHGHHHGHSHLVDESQQGQLIVHSDSNDDENELSSIYSFFVDHEEMINQNVAVAIESGSPAAEEEAPARNAADAQRKYVARGHRREPRPSHMNIKAVFLHIVADALGSVIVMVTSLILEFVPGDPEVSQHKWKLFLDPCLSLILVFVILSSAVPLLKRSGLILLQCVPKEVKVRELKTKLEQVEGIEKIHDLHIWQLQSNCFIGTVHLRCHDLNQYVKVSKLAKKVFHNFDIHCTTIQPEFAEHVDNESDGPNSGGLTPLPNGGGCVLDCGSQEQCNKDLCCPTKVPKAASMNHESSTGRPSPRARRAVEDATVSLQDNEEQQETPLNE